jgi:N-acetylmuramoyl-L-alanine amidase
MRNKKSFLPCVVFRPILLFLSLFLVRPSAQAPGQSAPGRTVAAMSGAAQDSAAVFQNLSLDDTLAALKSVFADSREDVRPEFRWDPFLRGGVFSLGGHYAAFCAALVPGETGLLMLDGREIFTVSLPYREGGELVFPSSFARTLRDVFSRSLEEDASRFRIAAIIIDPGHGGRDPGAIGTTTLNGKTTRAVEKDIVLGVSKQLKKLLDRAYPDKRVFMTRDDDTYPSLEDRVAIANSVPLLENEAIIYISIHANYVFSKNIRGYEVWYLSPDYRRNVLDRSKYPDDIGPLLNDMLQEEYTTESVMMARSILRGFQETLGSSMPSRGIKAEEWFVVRNSRMPAVLVELGFVSNPEDAALMTSEAGLRKLTDALYKGITEFVGVFEHSGGFTTAR